MSDLPVVAVISSTPGSEDVVRQALLDLVDATLSQDEGCLSYDLYESAAAPGSFVTVEAWSSQGHLEAHLQTPHIAAALAAVDGHLAAVPAIHPLLPVTR